MVNRKLLWMVCACAVVALAAPRAKAGSAEHKTAYLTFSQPLSLPGVGLGAGTYVFEIANPDSGANIVRVMSRDRSISYFMGFTNATTRPHALRNHAVSLGESAAGVPPPITVWWPENDSTGRQFVYPATR